MTELGEGLDLRGADDELLELLLADERLEPAPIAETQVIEQEFPYPSLGQERLWFFDRLEPGSAAYNVSFSLDLRGPLERRALEAAVLEVVRRHQTLRLRFVELDAGPRLQISSEAHVDFRYRELPPSDCADAELRRACEEHALQSFDLQRGPLFSVLVLRVASDRHLFAAALHHSIADGWSLALLQREIAILYAAFISDKPSPLAPLTQSYTQYAAWQRRPPRERGLEAQLDYWREQLRGAPVHLDLPTDYARPPIQSYRGGRVQTLLSTELTAALRSLGVRCGVSRFMIFGAALATILARIADQETVVIGTPVADRGLPGSEALIGYLLNTLPLRVELGGDPNFDCLLQRVRETCLQAYDRADLPFERMLDAAEVPRDTSRSPLFQVMLNVLDFDWRPELVGLEVSPFTATEIGSKFDLTLYVREQAGQLSCELGFNADLFSIERMQGLLDQLLLALNFAIEQPLSAVSTLSLVTERARPVLPDPRRPLTAEWHGSIVSRFLANAERTPRQIALVDAARSWSYAELDQDSRQIAERLRAAGARRAAVVAVHAARSGMLAVTLLGVWRAGAVFVILDPAHPKERRASILRAAKPAVFLQLAGAPEPEPELQRAVTELGCTPLAVASSGVESPTLTFEPSAPIGPEDIAYLGFTSGSSGDPKGIIGTHRPLSHFFAWQAERFGLTAQDRFSVLSGLSHDPLLRDLFLPLWVGGTAVFPSERDTAQPDALHAWLEAQRISAVHLTPSHGEILAAAAPQPSPLTALRYLFFGGEPLKHSLLRQLAPRLAQAQCVNLYGATETPQAIAEHAVPWPEPSGREAADPASVGSGIGGAQLLILNARDQLCGVGEPGEIVVRSPYLAAGYLDDAGGAPPFCANPLGLEATDRAYRTGDLARYRPDGTLALGGRRDRQLKIRGHRLESREIELFFEQHPAVEQAVVLGLAHPTLGQGFVVYVTGEHAPNAQLLAWAQARLPGWMVPFQVIGVATLPLTPNGKLDTARLPAPAFEPTRAPFEPPQSETERHLSRLWAQLLGVSEVGLGDSFFELGGHSLTATRLVAAVREAYGVELPLRTLFEARTLRAFAHEIDVAAKRGLVARPGPQARPAGSVHEARASFAQERLWFLAQLEPQATAYLLSHGLTIRGPLDVAALRSALSALAARQAAFRTSFSNVDGEAWQTVHGAVELELEVVDLSAFGPKSAQFSTKLAELSRETFDLTRAPLARTCLIRTGPSEWTLVLVMHHLITDGWSMNVLVQELSELYTARAQGKPPALPELCIDYLDYAHWQRASLSGDTLQVQLDYWKKQLAALPQALDLPIRRARSLSSNSEAAAASVSFRLPLDRVSRLERLAEARGITRFMLLLAGFSAVLGSCSGQHDIPIGTPVANRARGETAHVIGLFANTLVLRVDLLKDPTFVDLLDQVRELTLSANAHQDLPFARLVQELAPERAAQRSPLFQVLFALQTRADAPLQAGALELTPLALPPPAAAFDLTLLVEERAGDLIGTFQYPVELFDRETLILLGERLATLFERAAAAPDQSLSCLLAPSESELALLLERSRSEPEPCPGFVHRDFEAQARRTPHAIALESGNAALSYAELDWRANRLADRLRARELASEELIGVYAGRHFEFVIAWLAVLKVGAAFLPLDPALPHGRLGSLLQAARVRWVLTTHALEGHLPETVSSCVISEAWAPTADVAPPSAPAELEPDQLAYAIFTSGSTGSPKGVLLHQRGLTNLARSQARAFRLEPGSRQLQFASLGFDAAVSEVFTALTCGATLCLAQTDELASGHGLLELLERRAISHATLPPSLLGALPEQPLPTLSTLISAGEACSAEVVRRFRPGRRLLNAYGPTEVTVCASMDECSADDRTPGLGRPLPNQRVYLLDEQLAPAPPLAPAQLAVGGVGVARGYLGDAAATARAFVPDPLGDGPGARRYLTGDLARYRADGSLEFLGRRDGQLKIRGHRVETAELENALVSSGLAREAVVLGRRFGEGDVRLVAYLVSDAAPSLAAVKRRLQGDLPHYLLPSAVVHLDYLPRTASGKLDRNALPDVNRADGSEQPGASAPLDDIELQLVGIFERLLGIAPIGTHDDFFARGGHSLLALRLMSEVERTFARSVPLRVLFETPSVVGLAAALRSGEPACSIGPSSECLVPLSPPSAKPALFLVHPIGGQLFCYRDLALRLGRERAIVGIRAGFDAPSLEGLANHYAEAIVAYQPQGPYEIAGWSFGGYLALEIARHLTARQARVESVRLIDCHYPTLRQVPNEPQLLLEFLRDRIGISAQLTPDHAALVGWFDTEHSNEELHARLVEAGIWPADEALATLERDLGRLRRHFTLLAAYEPRPYAGAIQAFHAAGSYERAKAAPRTWRELAATFEEQVLPGDHYSLLRAPRVEALAQAMTRISAKNP